MKHVLIYFLFFSYYALSQELVSIQILASSKISRVTITFKEDYALQSDNQQDLLKLYKDKIYTIYTVNDSMIQIQLEDKQVSLSNRFIIVSPNIIQAELTIHTEKPNKYRTYKGNLLITAKNNLLKLINILELDNYVCGVVQAETGKGKEPEFYKAQALLVRTYALSHLYKHQPEGFNLCDQVHCQVYYGTCQSANILNAVVQTHNQVITDSDLNLIVAAFHSNSGGQTINSEDVWGSAKSYLRSVKDTFSIGMPSYAWKKKILYQTWINYLKKNKYPTDNEQAMDFATHYTQLNRNVYLQWDNIKLPLKNIREDFKLMSTFFDVKINDTKDTVMIYGRGFGHGVGLSQEGAMKMSKLGYSYLDIINFYFQNIIIIDLKKLSFFREE